jgi:Protein of unknown function (DUF2950)
MQLQNSRKLRLGTAAGLLAAGTILAGLGLAAAEGQTFATPDMAAQALVHAAEGRDVAAVLKILGPSATEVLTTSDPVSDKRMRQMFVQKAKEKTRVVTDPQQPKQKILEVGNDNWPFPIPIVQTGGRWQFDLGQGKTRIALRRIGNNELNAIDVARGYVEAQNEYFQRDPMGTGVHQYAQRFISTDGRRDGLYWKTDNPDDESPIAELVAKAIAEGYTSRTQPYHGYYFKVLKAQGPHAPGGAMDYIKNGAMTGGFAMIAWPADYRSTGVMTFVVDRSGIVYQKDLGPKTAEIARDITVYDPDETWTPVSGTGVPKSPAPVRSTSRRRPTQ